MRGGASYCLDWSTWENLSLWDSWLEVRRLSLTETSIPVPVKQVSMIRNWPRWAKWFNSRTGMSPRRFIWPSLETQLKWCTWYVFSILPEFVWVLAFCIHLLDSELALLGGFKSISTVLSDNGKFKQGHKGSLLYGWCPHIYYEGFYPVLLVVSMVVAIASTQWKCSRSSCESCCSTVSMCCVSTSCLRCSAMWVSKDAYTPKVRWGTESGQYTHAAEVRKPPSLLCLGRGVVVGGSLLLFLLFVFPKLCVHRHTFNRWV